ncbi:MAG TPA: FecR domain-containing protein, partial [Burkholderiaceae bacterium]|nr:FecR domain-containing protein [Burkholderiaceae bacterium]
MSASTRPSGERAGSARAALFFKTVTGHGCRAMAALAFAALMLPLIALAQDARVIMVSGEVQLVRDGGGTSSRVAVSQGHEVRAGDLVITGVQGHAQLRFSDGAVVSLQPRTEFRIDEYQFDIARQRAFYSLLRGAIRTATGAIGKRNRDDYRLQTPTATVGIRGTLYSAEQTVCDPACLPGPREGLRVAVVEGRIAVRSAVAEIEVGAGQSAVVDSPASTPRLTASAPLLVPPALNSQPASGPAVSNSLASAETVSSSVSVSTSDSDADRHAAQASMARSDAVEAARRPASEPKVLSGKTGAVDGTARTPSAAPSEASPDPDAEGPVADAPSSREKETAAAKVAESTREALASVRQSANLSAWTVFPRDAAQPGYASLASPGTNRGADGHLSIVSNVATAVAAAPGTGAAGPSSGNSIPSSAGGATDTGSTAGSSTTLGSTTGGSTVGGPVSGGATTGGSASEGIILSGGELAAGSSTNGPTPGSAASGSGAAGSTANPPTGSGPVAGGGA